MIAIKSAPVFCDCCNSLAVAELDNAPMCMDCLVGEISMDKKQVSDLTLIRPLSITPFEMPAVVKTKGKAVDSSNNTGNVA